ncbi:hypothetical protein AB0I22_23675 [Streptomyces sp. NPDC050610]|uniref:hypothetical protein n=1 Tax=Streptomyces sp. NPDC050610 TaxID=3157097 RepID=UPI003432B33E
MGGKAYGQALRAVACALMGWQVWLVWRLSSYDASTVEWTCDGTGTCASDQFASMAPFVGIGSALLFGFLAARFLQRAVVGASVTLAALAAIAGWYDAVDAGRVAYGTVTDYFIVVPIGRFPVSGWLTFLWAVAGAGCLAAWWGAAVSMRRTAALRRLSRRYTTADAELHGWRTVGGKYGEVTVVFDDLRGDRHEVPAIVERVALERTVQAVYDQARPDDPACTRVAVSRRKLLRFS